MAIQTWKQGEQSKLIFLLREIDIDKTRDRVEDALNTCRLFMQIGYHPGIEPKTTPSWSESPSSQTNAFHSSTESADQKNVDIEQAPKEFVTKVLLAVKRLNKTESAIITKRYLEDDDVLDYDVYNDVSCVMSQRKYYRVKSRAFYKLVLTLKLELYKFERGDTRLSGVKIVL